jgi:hypothetical protein
MIITQVEQDPKLPNIVNSYPDQFVPEKTKLEDPTHIKNTLDFYAHIAFAQHKRNRETFVKNYDLVKGIITWEDFYSSDDTMVTDFMNTIAPERSLPSYVKHYPIMNRPINTLMGELSRRPDVRRVRAYDDDSRSEELEYKTQLVQQLIIQQARNQIIEKFAMQEQELSGDELEQLTSEKVQDYIVDYTSLGERWGNHILTAMKAELEMKDKSEEAFRDLLISSREFFHVYEDNSKRGFDCEVANTKNVFHSPSNDQKYSKKWYYGGLLRVMELSEIIERFPKLTKDEIDHLVEQVNDGNRLKGSPSNFDSLATGPDTIKYDTYHRLVEQERDFLSAELMGAENDQGLGNIFNQVPGTSNWEQKFAVMEVYYLSKKLIGKLTFVDTDGTLQTVLVDESYEEGAPGEMAIEWGYINQWYKGVRIGTEVYHVEPFKLLDYCPIIGVIHEVKNTRAQSMVDLLKSFQSIVNVCLNQAWEILEKEIGTVAVVNLRRIPVDKDADNHDAVADFKETAIREGIIYEDDSPENTRVPTTNTNLTRAVDLSKSAEIKSRIEMAEWAKRQAMELVGMSEARMGGVAATQTATGTQTELTQSFAQTEPYFAQHEYVMDQVFQAILDACQYIESNKPQSTISTITNSGENAFIQVTPEDIKLRDLHVLSTSRAEDTQLFQEIRALAQPMLQNGASTYEVIELYATNSIRQMKQAHKALKDRKEQMEDQGMQMQQQQLQQQQQQFQAQMQEQARQHQLDTVNENINKELDRKNKLEIAIIGAMGRAQATGTDANQDGVLDIYQTQDLVNQYDSQLKTHEANLQKLNLEREKLIQDGMFKSREISQQDRALDIQEQNDKNDIKIAQIKLQQEKLKLKAASKKASQPKSK